MGSARRFKNVFGRVARPGVVAVVAAVASAGLLPAPAANAQPNGTETVTVGTRQVDVTFNDPGSTVQWNKAAKLINDAPSGSTIRIGLYNIENNQVLTAIKAAHNRKVLVYIVANGENHENARGVEEKQLADLLGSRFKWCDADGAHSDACISRKYDGLMHAKYMLFSETKGSTGAARKNVVWVSSANFSVSGVGQDQQLGHGVRGPEPLHGLRQPGLDADVDQPRVQRQRLLQRLRPARVLRL